MNFSTARDMQRQGIDLAYTVGVHDAFIGYEGLVFDRKCNLSPPHDKYTLSLPQQRGRCKVRASTWPALPEAYMPLSAAATKEHANFGVTL